MPFDEDITDFLDTDEFADVATVAGSVVNGIFESVYIEVNGVDSLRPTFYCGLSDVALAVQNDAVVVNGDSYTVLDIQPETPFCLLVLHNA